MARKSERTQPPADRPTAYAEAVCARQITAGIFVQRACKRHLDDVARQAETGLKWDLNRAIGFFEEVLHLSAGEFEGRPFELQPWQTFIVGSLFG
jgi:phage terminase large subunit-like protein